MAKHSREERAGVNLVDEKAQTTFTKDHKLQQHLLGKDFVSRGNVRFGMTYCGIRFRKGKYANRCTMAPDMTSCEKCHKEYQKQATKKAG